MHKGLKVLVSSQGSPIKSMDISVVLLSLKAAQKSCWASQHLAFLWFSNVFGSTSFYSSDFMISLVTVLDPLGVAVKLWAFAAFFLYLSLVHQQDRKSCSSFQKTAKVCVWKRRAVRRNASSWLQLQDFLCGSQTFKALHSSCMPDFKKGQARQVSQTQTPPVFWVKGLDVFLQLFLKDIVNKSRSDLNCSVPSVVIHLILWKRVQTSFINEFEESNQVHKAFIWNVFIWSIFKVLFYLWFCHLFRLN